VRIAVLELPARFGEPERALADVPLLLADDPRPDLAMLPEASVTGYVSALGDFDLTRFAEPLDGPTVARFRELARRTNVAIAAPLIERDGERVFNTYLVLSPDGEIVAHYRKRHPWIPETWATAGDAPPPVFTISGVAVTIAICFDGHFLEADAVESLVASDVLLFPSAWVEGENEDERATLLGKLAKTFGVTIANANWGPGSPRVRGQGASRFVGPNGELCRAESRPNTALRLDAFVQTKTC
jgi:predicted amidohydrolase